MALPIDLPTDRRRTLSIGDLVRRILLTIFLLSLVVGAGGFFMLLRARALQTATHEARLLLETAVAVSDYTDEKSFPLLAKLPSDRFYEQVVPFHVAQAVFQRVQARYPAYSFREPVLNPTNTADRPTPFEVELIDRFRRDTSLRELSGIRYEDGRAMFYLAAPIRVSDQSCLVCHSTPSRAPSAMVAQYGDNGFGWTMGETVGIEALNVPATEELRGTTELCVLLIAGLLTIFLVTYAALTASLGLMLVRPLRSLAQSADAASQTSDRLALSGSGVLEIRVLANAIDRLRKSLRKALGLPEEPSS